MLHFASGIVAGVTAMHSFGVAHRDIKSPNVLLDPSSRGGEFLDPVICDFGLARAAYVLFFVCLLLWFVRLMLLLIVFFAHLFLLFARCFFFLATR